MTQFYAEVNGKAKNSKTATGTKKSGLSALITGWDIGVFVECVNVNGKDIISIWENGGTENEKPKRLLATIEKENE